MQQTQEELDALEQLDDGLITDISDMMLTTIDNPYNPKEDYYKWRQWDIENGHHTESYLARIAEIPDDVDSDDEIIMKKLTNDAVISILENDTLGIYYLV